MSCTHS